MITLPLWFLLLMFASIFTMAMAILALILFWENDEIEEEMKKDEKRMERLNKKSLQIESKKEVINGSR